MSGTKLVARNKRAYRDYAIEEQFEAGLSLLGSEVKSLRAGKASLTEAFIDEEAGELYLVQAHIAPYEWANLNNHDPMRRRKLLLHGHEIDRISRRINERGFTAVALSIYFKGGKAKLALGLAKGKRQVDKRHDIRQRDENREMEREMKLRNR
jgi:SsrA-binding protein